MLFLLYIREERLFSASNIWPRLPSTCRASKAKVLRLEKEAREMERTAEALRHSQAKVAELEKTNKKLYAQTHTDRKEIIKLREVSCPYR